MPTFSSALTGVPSSTPMQHTAPTRRRELVEGVVHLRIIDTGIGIPRERLAVVFDPFV
jgi:signal transduction histidine kinase